MHVLVYMYDACIEVYIMVYKYKYVHTCMYAATLPVVDAKNTVQGSVFMV